MILDKLICNYSQKHHQNLLRENHFLNAISCRHKLKRIKKIGLILSTVLTVHFQPGQESKDVSSRVTFTGIKNLRFSYSILKIRVN